MKRAALLICLAGCSNPFAPVESGGAYWLADVSEDVFEFGLSSPNPPNPANVAPLPERGSWMGDQAAHLVLRRLQKGGYGTLRESERFTLSPGSEVLLGVAGVFELLFTANPRADAGWTVDSRFAWEGRPVSSDRMVMPPSGNTFAFLRPMEGKRYALLLVSLAGLER